MSKRMRGAFMMALAMAAMADTDGIFARRRPVEVKPRDNTRARKLYKVDLTEHEFVIHGEIITAKNRKMALKIYANRHKSDYKKK